MVQAVKTTQWTATNGDVRWLFKAGEDAGPLVFSDALNLTAAEWAGMGIDDTARDAAAVLLAETRYSNWKAAVAAASSYVRTAADERQEVDDQENIRKAAWDSREAAKVRLVALEPLTKQEWLDEEALQEQIRLDAVSAKGEATTEVGKL